MTINNYANKLQIANLDAKYVNHKRVLDFVIKKGEWTEIMRDIEASVASTMINNNRVLINIKEF